MSDEAIERRLTELRDTAKAFAKAYAQREYLDEFKKSKLAMLMKQAEVKGHVSAAAQEREARASADYLELLEGLRDATEQAEGLRWQLKIAEIASEVWRTKEASKRAEKRGYGA